MRRDYMALGFGELMITIDKVIQELGVKYVSVHQVATAMKIDPYDYIFKNDFIELTLDDVFNLIAKKSIKYKSTKNEFGLFLETEMPEACIEKLLVKEEAQEESASKPEPEPDEKPIANNKLMAIFKKQRSIWAAEKKIPAFCVFSNEALVGILALMPRSKEELLSIKGLGKRKTETYGDKIIEVINNFLGDDKTLVVAPKTAIKENIENEAVEEFEEDENLKLIKSLIKKGKNLFITGSAGCGKSYILNKLKREFTFEVTSTTGMAAVNINGQTIHSWAGVGICSNSLESCVKGILRKKDVEKRIKDAKILAIDEISMLDAFSFNYIDSVLRQVRNKNTPFGGMQLLIFGDFFQLPPVNKENGFCFESPVWQELELQNVVLTKIYRQDNKDFSEMLNKIRQNQMDDIDFTPFYERNNKAIPKEKSILHIFGVNKTADNYNNKKFAEINEECVEFAAKDWIMRNEIPKILIQNEDDIDALSKSELQDYQRLDVFCKAPRILALKKTARVMLLKNLDFEAGLINGTCGEVVEFKDDGIIVKFDNGTVRTIKRFEFEYMKDGKKAVMRVQYPLRLAYGITIHKSQGMTLDNVLIDFNGIFECGQAYVALSRVKSLDGLYLKSFSQERIMAVDKVVRFYESLHNVCENN